MKKLKGTEEALEGGDNQEPGLRSPDAVSRLCYTAGSKEGVGDIKGGPEALES